VITTLHIKIWDFEDEFIKKREGRGFNLLQLDIRETQKTEGSILLAT
jgi:hypothetical protein